MAYAKAPNSCELNKATNRGWQVQVKGAGLDAAEYQFVPGRRSTSVIVTTSSTDATDLDSGEWTYEEKTSRSLAVNLGVRYVTRGGADIMHEVQRQLKYAGEEIGANGKLDVRVWRDDIDEGWESTFDVSWTDTDGDATGFREADVVLTSVCAPTRIHSIEDGEHTAESVPLTEEELRTYLSGKTGSPSLPEDGGE